jgi:CelD/BcsL family acetyltransferase involved in cellulose biosynthesis
VTAQQRTSPASSPSPSPFPATGTRAPTAVLVEDIDSLAPHLDAWDALAVTAGKPFCAPGWMLSWWRGARSERTRLRVILIFEQEAREQNNSEQSDGKEQGRLVAVAPFFASTTFALVELRLFGAGFSHRIGVLAQDGAQERVAPVLAAALAAQRPASVVFEGVEAGDPWPDLVAANWPARIPPRLRTDGDLKAPVIELDGDYEAWLARRERRFRKESRRLGRRLEEERVSGRIACDEQSIDALLALHHARWAERGGSNVGEDARAVLLAAAAELPQPRLFVALLESPTGAVSAELVLRAGTAAAFWGGGFDPGWAQYGPGMQTMLLALDHLARDGVAVADLGGGAHPYKRRLADADTTLLWRTVFPRGWRYPLIRLRLAPKHVRLGVRKLARRLPPRWQQRLRGLLRR